MNLLVYAIETDGMVVVTNGRTEVPVGAIFTSIAKSIGEGVGSEMLTNDLGSIASVELVLQEVYVFRQRIAVIPSGYSAKVLLEGRGLDVLLAAFSSKLAREHIYLLNGES